MKKSHKDFKILFIYPNTMMATLVPMSMCVLYAYLKSKGFSVELFDSTFYKTEEVSFESKKVELLQVKEFNFADKGVSLKTTDIYGDLREKVKTYQPDLIGVTIVENTFPLALSLLKVIEDFDIPVIAGGVFVTNVPNDVISESNIDMVCIGEGEEALVELCERMAAGQDYGDVQNLWVKKNGQIIKNPLRPVVDLEKLPFIEYDVFEPTRLFRPMLGTIRTMIHVELERGCPYNCTYCETPHLKQLYRESGYNYCRRKSPARAVEELVYLVKKYRPDYINFNAESFLARPLAEFKAFAKLYKEAVALPFWCQSRPETITEEKVKILKEMGCQNTQFGIECGNEGFRAKVLNRHHTNEKLVRNLKLVEKYGIKYTVNNIIGFPDETRELIFETIELNRQISPSTINCYMFTPYKGTELYDYCIAKGYLSKDTRVGQALDGAPLRMDSISYEELKGLQRTFPLYAKMPKSQWDRIRIAERFDDEGNAMFEQLRQEYYENYF